MPDENEIPHPPELAEHSLSVLIEEIKRRCGFVLITGRLNHESPNTPPIFVYQKCERDPFAFLGVVNMAAISVTANVSKISHVGNDDPDE